MPGIEEVTELMPEREIPATERHALSQTDSANVANDDKQAFKGVRFVLGDFLDPDGARDLLQRDAVRHRAILEAELPMNFQRKLSRLRQVSELHQVDLRITCAHCPA